MRMLGGRLMALAKKGQDIKLTRVLSGEITFLGVSRKHYGIGFNLVILKYDAFIIPRFIV